MSAAKAWVAAVGTVVTALTGVLADEVVDIGEVSLLVTVLVEAAATVFAVYRIPNQPADVEPWHKSGEAGMATSELLLLVIAVCVVIGLVVGWGLVR